MPTQSFGSACDCVGGLAALQFRKWQIVEIKQNIWVSSAFFKGFVEKWSFLSILWKQRGNIFAQVRTDFLMRMKLWRRWSGERKMSWLMEGMNKVSWKQRLQDLREEDSFLLLLSMVSPTLLQEMQILVISSPLAETSPILLTIIHKKKKTTFCDRGSSWGTWQRWWR